MTLTKSRTLTVRPISGIVPAQSRVEPGTGENEFLPLAMENYEDNPDWTYSAQAEDNGTAGSYDLSPGLVYDGPAGAYARVTVNDLDVMEAITNPPEETVDTHRVVLAVNSEIVGMDDEGYTAVEEAWVEHNLDAMVGPLNEGDVVRVGIVFSGEEAASDIQTRVGSIVVS